MGTRHYLKILARFLCLASLTACSSIPPVHQAAGQGNTTQVLAMLDQGVDVNQPVPFDGFNENIWMWTPLHFAAAYGHADTARVLLDRGADVNRVAQFNTSPLHLAAQGGYLNVVRLLVERGADLGVRIRNGGATPVDLAERRGHAEIVQYLREAEARAGQGKPASATGPTPAAAPSKPVEQPPPIY